MSSEAMKGGKVNRNLVDADFGINDCFVIP